MRTLELSDAEYALAEQIARDLETDVRNLLVSLLVTTNEDLARRLSIDTARARVILSKLGDSVRKTPGLMGGAACIRNTRIPVWLLVAHKKEGMTDSDLLRAYPSLDASDLIGVWTYFAAHSEEIEQEILEQ